MKKLLTSFAISFLFFFLSTVTANAQVVINEFSSYESSGDWIELYSETDVDISNWKLRDEAASIMAEIPTGVSVGPTTSKFYIVEVSNRLNQDGDTITLRMLDDTTQVDQVSYGSSGGTCATENGTQSIGRNPDGTGSFSRFSSSSKSTTNFSNSTFACPTPTPTPTPTSAPTSAPTNTPTATPKPTPTKTSTPKPTVKPTATPEGTEEPTSTSEVLGDTTFGESTPLATPLVEGTQVKNFPFIAVGMIVLGIVFIGIPIVWFWRQKAVYNESGDENIEKQRFDL